MSDKQERTKDFMSTAETAGKLGVAEPTLRTWRARGKGPRYYQMGRMIRYRPKDVEEWMNRNYRLVEPER